MKTKLNTQLLGILLGLFLLSTSLFAKDTSFECDVTNIEVLELTCEPDGSYTLCLSIWGEGLPATPDPADLKLVIDHETVDWGFDYGLTYHNGTQARICVNLTSENRTNLDVFVRINSGCTYTAYNLYNEPTDCEPAPACNITDFTARTPSCLYYDVYEVIFDVTGENLPTSDNDVEVEIDGVNYQVTRYTPNGARTEAEVWVTVLRDNQQDVDVSISLTNDCSLTKQDVYDEPDCGDLPVCNITNFTARTPSCLYYDVYEVIFDVTGENLPTSDNEVEVEIDGVNYQVTRYTPNGARTEAEVWVTVLRDNQQDVDVSISLTNDCSLTKQDVYDEPDCGDLPVCNITNFTARTPSCLYYDVYEVIFDVTGENLPTSDNEVEVEIDGVNYQVTRYTPNGARTEAEVWVTVLRDNQQDVDVSISLTNDCSLTKQDVYDEPDCGDLPVCNITNFTARTPSCLYYDVYEVIFDVTGENLPTSDNEVEVEIDGVNYQVTRYTPNGARTEAEVWVTVLRDNQQDVDVSISLTNDCSLTKQDIYDEPDCGDDPAAQECDITSLTFLSVQCQENNNYDLSIQIEGVGFDSNLENAKVIVDHQPYPILGTTVQNTPEGIIASFFIRGIEGNGDRDIEVFVQVESGCTFTARDLYDEPDCYNARLGREGITDFQIYPNPSNGQFSVEIPNTGKATLTVFDQMGRVVHSLGVQGNTLEKIRLSQLTEGVYFIRIRNENDILTKRIMIKN